MQVRFDLPAETRRPGGRSHRFDVYGLKISRSLTLFHRNMVNCWIDLERDPAVTWYCERPLVIDDAPFKRLVDFYVIRHGKEELRFVLSDGEEVARLEEDKLGPGFLEWCRQNAIGIRIIDSTSAMDHQCATENWAQILRELSAFARYVPAQLADAIRHEIAEPQTLDTLASLFPKVDPILLKVASFSLLHQGRAACPGLETQPFTSNLAFAAV